MVWRFQEQPGASSRSHTPPGKVTGLHQALPTVLGQAGEEEEARKENEEEEEKEG